MKVNVSENSVHGRFIGHNVTLGCLAIVDDSVDTDITVSFTWKFEGSEILTTPRTLISERPLSTKNTYFSELLILEIDREFEGSYMCSFKVLSINSKKPILPTEASREVKLIVEG